MASKLIAWVPNVPVIVRVPSTQVCSEGVLFKYLTTSIFLSNIISFLSSVILPSPRSISSLEFILIFAESLLIEEKSPLVALRVILSTIMLLNWILSIAEVIIFVIQGLRLSFLISSKALCLKFSILKSVEEQTLPMEYSSLLTHW